MKRNENIPLIFDNLVKQAEELIKTDISAEQAVSALTSKGNVYCFANHQVTSGNTQDEIAFGKILIEREDTRVTHVVCMWSDHTIDVVSQYLRNMLIELNSSNLEAEILLRAGEEFHVKSWKVLMAE